MMLPIAGPVQPEHFPRRVRRRQRVQHRQNWSRPDARAEQHDRPLAGLQNEASARRADFESIPPPPLPPRARAAAPPRAPHPRALSVLQNEASARRADFESIPPPDMLAQVASGSPIRLELHADS